MRHSAIGIGALVVLTLAAAGCSAAGRAFNRGESAARGGDWDSAVEYYRQAVQEEPDDTSYQIALERAMISASIQHLDQARLFEVRGQLDQALREYRRAAEYDPPNAAIAAKVAEVERAIRDQVEQARARQVPRLQPTPGPTPLFNMDTVVDPILFEQASLRDILDSIGEATDINVTYDSTYQDRVYSTSLQGVTLRQALDQIVSANQLFYKVLNQRTIMVIPDNAQKRAQFEEQVVRTFPISYADPQELATTLNTVIRPVGQQLAPAIAASPNSNTITVRATASLMAIIERMIEVNDSPRAEVIVDVQILEVNKNRARQFGLDLGSYSISATFSPEVNPRATVTPGEDTDPPVTIDRTFNANTITRGVSPSDFYLSVPGAVVRFLETDAETKVIAKPQLRGAEGTQLSLNLGEDVPVPTTTFTPLAQGGANFNPLTSFDYRSVGVNVIMTPRVTIEGDIMLDLEVENSTLGAGVVIAGQELPSFASRRVETALRLREGESTLLAGLLREQERTSLTGFPGILRLPVIRTLFSSNDQQVQQTDIVMLLTPRIVRTQEYTPEDLAPLFIGTQANIGLTDPPATIGQVATPAVEAVPDAAAEPAATAAPAPLPGTAEPAFPQGAALPGPPTAGGQILVSVPGQEFVLGGGPYLVPVSVFDATQLSGVTLTITYNPAVLRLVSVQEGSFMRTGGLGASFTQQPDPANGRIDIAIIRPGDQTGVAGTGLLAGLLFEPIASGPANLAVVGSATGPGGAPVRLSFQPITPVRVP